LNSAIPEIGVHRRMSSDPAFLKYQFKSFDEMTDADYQLIGFRSGLEIHQQLLTSKKLFCRCPAGHYSDHYHAEMLRHMRPTLSELGEYDGTALMEFKTRKNIVYHINRDTVCTYEMDDTPPFLVNEEALEIAFRVALLLRTSTVDEIHIARKQYLDGSIPAGFQRTTIVGVNGWIPFKDRKIDIHQLGLEEDSCREVSDIGHERRYLTDRLGMPLIETVTAPQMITPTEVGEVGDLIRRLARSTGRVRTGIGAARQDVNVSIHGGTRIEIKGVPRLPMIPLLTYNEAMRQHNLLRLRAELYRRGISIETFRSRTEDVTRLLKKCRFQTIREAIANGKVVRCVTLSGFRNLLHWPTQTDTYFGREIADRVQVIACLTTLPNILHSDSHSDALSTSEWLTIRKTVGASEDDTLVLVWGDLHDTDTATREIAIRAREATMGVPSETRQALPDGTTGFERILPGPDRMYPDTDLPPRKVTRQELDTIRVTLPDFFWDRESWYETLNVPKDCIQPLAISPFAGVFKEAVEIHKIDPKLAAVILIQFTKAIARRKLPVENLQPHIYRQVFQLLSSGQLLREWVFEAMKSAAATGRLDVNALPSMASDKEIEATVKHAVDFAWGIKSEEEGPRNRTAMGFVMERLKGRASGSRLVELVAARMKEKSVSQSEGDFR
jgi:glutamyl-tRNA(Gln) amidotransferase subunit E